ncbi:hypothetical protein H4R33_000565 [Dimargaris cristalligena]|uniref:Uncharacterized protein n=1 Tax=Dimargaris cristalligena TaxID=215637 RepID=A0A4P9ZYA2_9FUNG|nr:hypothetical protein H4R33_000565 [Dimargaris cristalligena]RKP37750.1 hypothetical protein BJ085DRAFT_38138 [Dimargaris cristalligena]|eukprot:RKP37750.1 hypothetical protein BJ085DRAFT_38138 [Dimargaris cristalligena]
MTDCIEYKIAKKSLNSNTKLVTNSAKLVEYTVKSNHLGSEKAIVDTLANEVVWERVSNQLDERKRSYLCSSSFTRIELKQRQHAQQKGRYRFYWCGEEYMWKHYGYTSHHFKCVHTNSGEVVADFRYLTWAVLEMGRLKLFPKDYLRTAGLKEFIIFSCIDLLEDSLLAKKGSSPLLLAASADAKILGAAGYHHRHAASVSSDLETTPFLASMKA